MLFLSNILVIFKRAYLVISNKHTLDQYNEFLKNEEKEIIIPESKSLDERTINTDYNTYKEYFPINYSNITTVNNNINVSI